MDAAVASPVGPFTQVASLVGQPGDALVALSETPHRLAERLGQILPPLTARLDQATPSAEASDPSSSEITLGLDTIVHDLNGHDRGLKRFLALLEEKLSASHADRERLVTHLTAQLEEGKASQRLHALTHEQELHHLERQNQQYQAALTKANARLTALEKDLAAALQASHQHRDILAQRDTQNDELREQIQKLQQRLERAEVDKNERVEQLDQRLQEIERVENRCNELSAQLAEAKNAAALNETHIQEAKYNETTAKIQLASKEQELHLLQRNNESLNAELSTKSDLFAKYRQETSRQVTELKADTDRQSAELQAAQQNASHLQKRLNDQSERLEEALNRARETQLRLVEQEEGFKAEMGTQTKLAQLWEKTAKEAKERIQDLEDYNQQQQLELADKSETWAAERAALQDTVHSLKEQLATADLQLEKLQIELKNINGLVLANARGHLPKAATPSMMLSPTAALASQVQRSGKSFTQIYSENVNLQDQLRDEQKESRRLRECLDRIVKDIEERTPILNEQRRAYEQVCEQAEQLGGQLAEAQREKDESVRQADELRASLDQVLTENQALQQQVHDLGRQVQTLLREVDETQHAESLMTADGSVISQARTDTDRVINEQLTTFRDIQELQQQNQRLLRVTRELADRMEREEQAASQKLTERESQVMKDAETLITELRDELKLTKTKLQSYIHERDMLQRMLNQHKPSQQQQQQRKGFGADVPTLASPPLGGVPETPTPSGRAPAGNVPAFNAGAGPSPSGLDYPALLHELQVNFDNYRAENGIDLKHLQAQLDTTQREASEHRLQHARAQAQVDFLNERYQALVTNGEAQSRDLQHLRERLAQSQEALTQGERKNQQAVQDLLEAHEKLEQVKHEAANLRAENQLVKSMETRLLQENESLLKERSRLSDLMVGLQRVQNELERSESDAKRRFENQVENLERSLHTARAKLQEEVDLNKSLTFRREAESQRHQTRIDQLVADHQKAREQLVAAQTSVEHLQNRVDDLTNQLRVAEENAKRSGAASHAIPGTLTSTSTSSPPTAGSGDSATLAQECNRLREQLAEAHQQIENLKERVGQFQAISTSSEEALARLNTTYDEFKQTSDRERQEAQETMEGLRVAVADKETRIQEIMQELSEGQGQLETLRHQLEQEKMRTVHDTEDLKRRTVELEGWLEKAKVEVRQQTQRTEEAQANYTREVTLHAEDIRLLTDLRARLTEVQQDAQAYLKKAETAESKLNSSETSWEGQKQLMEKTAVDLEKRIVDLEQQNNLLHAHLETVNAQALRISNAAPADGSADALDTNGDSAASSGAGDATPNAAATANKSVEELREVVRYMRRDKEILRCQHEMALQETKRLKQQLEHKVRALEETRSMLTEERQREQEALLSATQHTELMAKIQELNILRESNTTLRAESTVHANRVRTLEETLRARQAELEPLKEQLYSLQADLEVKQQETASLEADARHWKERAQQILQKYDRIDPQEHQNLQNALTAAQEQATLAQQARERAEADLQAERSRMQSELGQQNQADQQRYQQDVTALRTELEQTQGQLQQAQQMATKATEQRDIWERRTNSMRDKFNAKLKEKNAQNAEAIEMRETRINELTAQVKALEAQLAAGTAAAETRADNEEGQAENTVAVGTATANDDMPVDASPTPADSPAELSAQWAEEKALLEQTIADLQSQIAEYSKAEQPQEAPVPVENDGQAQAEVTRLQGELQAREAQIRELDSDKQRLLTDLQAAEKQLANQSTTLEEYSTRIIQLETQVQELQAKAKVRATAAGGSTDAPEPATTPEVGATEATPVVNAELDQLRQQVEEWKQKYNDAHSTGETLRGQIQALQEQLKAKTHKVSELETALTAANEKSTKANQAAIDAALAEQKTIFNMAQQKRQEENTKRDAAKRSLLQNTMAKNRDLDNYVRTLKKQVVDLGSKPVDPPANSTATTPTTATAPTPGHPTATTPRPARPTGVRNPPANLQPNAAPFRPMGISIANRPQPGANPQTTGGRPPRPIPNQQPRPANGPGGGVGRPQPRPPGGNQKRPHDGDGGAGPAATPVRPRPNPGGN